MLSEATFALIGAPPPAPPPGASDEEPPPPPPYAMPAHLEHVHAPAGQVACAIALTLDVC